MKHTIKIEREFDLSDTDDLDKFKRYQEDVDLKQKVLELIEKAMETFDADFAVAQKNHFGVSFVYSGPVTSAHHQAYSNTFDILKNLRATVRAL